MQSIKSQLQQLTQKKHIFLTPSGDDAIESVCRLIRGKHCLIPDQGGWLSYKKIPKKLDCTVEEIKTTYAVIDIEDLKNKSKMADCIIYQQPGGYFAQQPQKEIYERCKGKVNVIQDVTGCIGHSQLYDSSTNDFIVCSFGKWKPIEVGYGGFFAFDDDQYVTDSEPYEQFDSTCIEKLKNELNDLDKKYAFFEEHRKKIIADLSSFDILYPDHPSIVVVILFKNNDEKESLINYCQLNELPFTPCPRYIRVLDNAISIEIKRLWVRT